jgi:eukaryotic-like serine/threonine-protein kinase
MAEPLPKRIGPWRIEAEIGRGMMGIVYKGRDPRQRVAAVKVVHIVFPLSEEERVRFEKRFIQEGRIVARLSHEGIVGVYDVGRDKRRVPYVALEFLEGRTLSAVLLEGPAPEWRESLGLVAQVAEALDHAHAQGVVHRDIKPANVMVLPSGRAKIMDFGLAKHDAGAELTSTGQFMGTPLYMSPEQALGEDLDSRTDLFSLGSVAYTLLTGKRAFEGDSVPHVMNRVAHQVPPPPTRVQPDLPTEVDYLIARSMAKRRDDRYPTGRMFAEDVHDVLAGRPPRHLPGWTSPRVGDGTMVSTLRPAARRDTTDALELEPLDDERPRRRIVPLALLGLALVALTVILFRSPFWLDRIAAGLHVVPASSTTAGAPTLASASSASSTPRATSSTAPAAEAPPDATPSEAPTLIPAGDDVAAASSTEDDVVVDDPSPEPGAVPGNAREEALSGGSSPLPAETPDAAPLPAPSSALPDGPVVRPSAPAASPQATPRPARPMALLAISFEHGIETGTLRVLVDRKPVLAQRLTSRVTKDLLLFKLRSGVARNTLHVAPGQRRIRVEVKTPDDARAKETVVTFRSGRTRHLELKIGRLRGNLSLAWR